MSHDFVPYMPGLDICGICTRSKFSHQQDAVERVRRPVGRPDHNDMIRAFGRCDGRCGLHHGQPFHHNENLRVMRECLESPQCGVKHRNGSR